LVAVVKAAAVAAAENYTNHHFEFTTLTGQRWNNPGSVTGIEVDYYQSFVTHSTGEASALGIIVQDTVHSIVVQAKPPPVAPTWRASTPDLQSIERTLVKASGEDAWGTSGAVSDEIIQHNAQRGGIAWTVDHDFVPVGTEQQNNSEGGKEYFQVSFNYK
jgi:hypothetical protein